MPITDILHNNVFEYKRHAAWCQNPQGFLDVFTRKVDPPHLIFTLGFGALLPMERLQVPPLSLCLWTKTPVHSIGFVIWGDRVICGHLGERDEATLVRKLRERVEQWATGNKRAAMRSVRRLSSIVEVFDQTVRHDFLSREVRVTPFESPLRHALRRLLGAVNGYFTGKRFDFLDIPLDLGGCPEFTRAVLERCRGIPYGETSTYRELAVGIGRPTAVRAVAQALARNPIPILIPCHRVIGSDGTLRGYSGAGGTETKKTLIAMEKWFRKAREQR